MNSIYSWSQFLHQFSFFYPPKQFGKKENTNLFLPQDQKILHNYNSNKDILNELMQNQRKNLIKNKLLYTDIKRLQQ